jgi:diaminohydroxyphosphoribosylaminopyrimidine deaminase / 5-amino-6-(5-phosphoribosylamino)uracil reductase
MEPEERFMKEAIELASGNRGRTHPNPTVGAVVVRHTSVVGRGFHAGPGTPHAEVVALEEAGDLARGADLYVTLEPCCTFGRTPPCTQAIIDAGIARVVAAVKDPNPRVDGAGMKVLKKAGIDVVLGFMEREGEAVDCAYHTYYRMGRPYVHLKWAQSLDGVVQPPSGRYLTGEAARRRVHKERFLADAILVSSGTVRADDPLLTVRLDCPEKPLIRVILDSPCSLNGREAVFATAPCGGPIWAVVPEGHANPALETREGVDVISLPKEPGGGFSLGAVLRVLRERQVITLYVEAVGRLASAFLESGFVDHLSVHVAPVLLGRESALAALEGRVLMEGHGLHLSHAVLESAGPDWIVSADLEAQCLPD